MVHRISRVSSNVLSVLITFSHPFSSVKRDIQSVPHVDPNSHAAPPAEAHQVRLNFIKYFQPILILTLRLLLIEFVGNIRNLAMEKVANTVFFPCKYSGNGCGNMLQHTEKVDHEDACEFRPYICPCPGASCKWQGSLEQVMPHLMMQHKSITTLQGNFHLRIPLSVLYAQLY